MPSSTLRKQLLGRARRLVVKVGSQLLSAPDGGVDLATMRAIAGQIATLVKQGYDVTLVSSGAIAVGRQSLGLAKRPKDIAVLQGVAAVGQTGLMNHWHEAFAPHNLQVGQMLLTRGDFEDRNRYLNLRNCLTELHALDAVPIINENDAVAVDEIRLGDNDVLAALVTNALCADLLVLLTVVEGLRDGDGKALDVVDDIQGVMALAHKTRSALGTGGMQTKLEAARMVTGVGEAAVIACGRDENVLPRIVQGEPVGTLFVPAKRRLSPRLRWIGHAVRPAGVMVIDDGAARALVEGNKSLLASGISDVTGRFDKGDVIVVRDSRGREIARGLTNYNADEVRVIMGKRSSQFEKLLGRRAYDEVIHKDHMAVTGSAEAKAASDGPEPRATSH